MVRSLGQQDLKLVEFAEQQVKLQVVLVQLLVEFEGEAVVMVIEFQIIQQVLIRLLVVQEIGQQAQQELKLEGLELQQVKLEQEFFALT